MPLFELEASARTGSCLHEILELADLSGPADPEVEDLVHGALERYGLDPERWTGPVARSIGHVARVDLFEGDGAFGLGDVDRRRRVAEMEGFAEALLSLKER